MNDESLVTESNFTSIVTSSDIAAEELEAMLKELHKKIENFLDAMASDKDRLYVISTKGIGDFIMAGGLSQAVQHRKNKKSTVLVIQHSKWDTGILFPNVDGIISCPSNVIAALNRYFNETENYEGDNYIYANIRKIDGEYIWDADLNMLERLKKDAFKIPLDAPFVYPIIDEISEKNAVALHEKYILDEERTIILLPHAKTFSTTLNKEFWEKIAQRLKEKNYIVYTNVAGSEQPVEGTEPISITFNELYYITNKVKCFVGLNSGVFIFLAMTGAKTLNVTPFPHWYWDISFMFPDCNNRTFYDTKNAIEVVLDSISPQDVYAKIRYSHKKIAIENIFYSPEDILEAMLDEVDKN